jgi:hypothetical protein
MRATHDVPGPHGRFPLRSNGKELANRRNGYNLKADPAHEQAEEKEYVL